MITLLFSHHVIAMIRFDQLRVKRERHTGGGKAKHKPKPQKQNEAVGYLMFRADVTTISGQLICETRSEEIKLSKSLLLLSLEVV